MRSVLRLCGVVAIFTTSLGMDTLPSIRFRSQAHLAVSEDQAIAESAIAELRAAGPFGLKALFDAHGLSGEEPLKRESLSPQLLTAIDAVAGQRNAYATRLYWYTDLEQAKQMASRSRKPILSLRLLGKLTDELSCANSRFFRSTLYANSEISHTLRENFVLHWQSVRPAPKVTVDFGDGRKLENTVTGNSVHLLLDAAGRPLDALPGLYGPNAFAQWLADAGQLAREMVEVSPADRAAAIAEAHRNRIALIEGIWQADRDELRLPALPSDLDDTGWARLAQHHAGDAQLDDASRAFILAQNPNALQAGRRAVSKRSEEDPLVRMIRNLQQTIAIDTVRNEHTLHRQIHQWFAAGQVSEDLSAMSERIYRELFLTPSSDPWLGLIPSGAYTGLDGGGLLTAKSE